MPSSCPTGIRKSRLRAMSFSSSGRAASLSHLEMDCRVTPIFSPSCSWDNPSFRRSAAMVCPMVMVVSPLCVCCHQYSPDPPDLSTSYGFADCQLPVASGCDALILVRIVLVPEPGQILRVRRVVQFQPEPALPGQREGKLHRFPGVSTGRMGYLSRRAAAQSRKIP